MQKNKKDSVYDHMIVKAAKDGSYEDVLNCIKKGGDVNARDKNQMTPLMWAAHNGDAGIAKLLLTHGAGINLRDGDGYNAIEYAARTKSIAVGRFLISEGADVNNLDNNSATPLIWTVWNGDYDFTKLLLENGANIMNGKDKSISEITTAIYRNDARMYRLLVAWGAELDAKDRYGEGKCALGTAFKRCSPGFLAMVLEDVVRAENRKNRPLYGAFLEKSHDHAFEILASQLNELRRRMPDDGR